MIEIAPLAYMRGRTLSNAFVILDEAQNTTPEQMMMFLTRLGDEARMVVTGDITQIDLPRPKLSGLLQVALIYPHVGEQKRRLMKKVWSRQLLWTLGVRLTAKIP